MDTDDDNAHAWAEYELNLQQLKLAMDPDYALWLDRLNWQAEIARVQLDLFDNPHTH